MSKIQEMRKILSPSALAALETLGGEHIGYVVDVHPSKASVMTEFRKAGVVAEHDGLTVLGSGLAAVMRAEYLDRMF